MKFEKVYYPRVWADLLDAADHILELEPRNQWRGSRDSESMLRALGPYKLTCFCERYRVMNPSPWNDLPGDMPARIYLLNKHGWPPSQVLSLTVDELLLALHEELVSLRLNPVEAEPVRTWGASCGKFSLVEPHLEPLPDSD